jgi:hypothetical protein
MRWFCTRPDHVDNGTSCRLSMSCCITSHSVGRKGNGITIRLHRCSAGAVFVAEAAALRCSYHSTFGYQLLGSTSEGKELPEARWVDTACCFTPSRCKHGFTCAASHGIALNVIRLLLHLRLTLLTGLNALVNTMIMAPSLNSCRPLLARRIGLSLLAATP